jgi:hypothetical protein
MTFPPLASRSDRIEVRKRLNHLHRVGSQGAACLNERYSAWVHPLVKRTLGNADTPGTDARVHYLYCTPEIEAARNRGGLRRNSFIRLQASTADARPALEITDLGASEVLLRDTRQLLRSGNVLSAEESSLRTRAGADGSVVIKRPFGMPQLFSKLQG